MAAIPAGGRAIFDAKWKRLTPLKANSGVSSADSYQLNAYAGRYGCNRLALVYPAHDGCPPGLIAEFPFLTRESPVLVVIAIDVRELVKGDGIPLGMEQAIQRTRSLRELSGL